VYPAGGGNEVPAEAIEIPPTVTKRAAIRERNKFHPDKTIFTANIYNSNRKISVSIQCNANIFTGKQIGASSATLGAGYLNFEESNILMPTSNNIVANTGRRILSGTRGAKWLNPQHYIADVLARIADHPARRIAELLPWNWQPADATRAAA
jgi:hypothetical protein